MKKCSHCGRDNPDEATHCCGCGTQEFKRETPPIIPHDSNKQQSHSTFKGPLLLRILIASGVGLVVSGITLYVAWQQANHSIGWYEQRQTQRELNDIGQAITAYQQKSNSLPSTLEELRAMTNGVPSLEAYFEDGFVDGWRHPFGFLNEGTNCLVISFGHDGKPGGKGIDCDLTSKNPRPKESLPTFNQFLNNDRMHGMIVSSLVCGVLAALLSLLTVRIPSFSRRGLIVLVLSLGATVIGTLFVTTMITGMHVPSGH